MLRSLTLHLHVRWTRRRASQHLPQLLEELRQLVAEELEISADRIVRLQAERYQVNKGRRRYALVVVRIVHRVDEKGAEKAS